MTESLGGTVSGPLGRDRRLLVAVCWLQIAVAGALFVLSVVGTARQPRLGLVARPESGIVLSVTPGEPASNAGIRVGDDIVHVEGRLIGRGTPPFYDARPGVPIPLAIERNGLVSGLSLVPESARPLFSEAPFSEGGALWSSEALRVLVNLAFLVLATAILWMRSDLSAARVAAMALACWVGGNNLVSIEGFGSLVTALPLWLEISIHMVDVVFTIGFFALMVHFALLFPKPFPAINTSPQWQLVPYAAALPLAAVGVLSVFRFFVPETRDAIPPADARSLLELFGPLFIGADAFLLTQQFRYTESQNDRRRLAIVLLSLGPGFVTWILWKALSYASSSPGIHLAGQVLFWIGTAASGAIFAWAIVRHEVFEIRILLRKSIQYALARGTLIVLMIVPLTLLGLFLWVHRNMPLNSLVSQDLGVFLVLAAPVFLTYRYRHQLRELIDRRFFREEYDAHRALVRLTSMIQRGTDILFLGRLALTEIERSLHPTHLSFWRFELSSRRYRSVLAIGHEAKHPPLYENHPVVRHLAGSSQPLQVDLVHPKSELRQLSSEAEVWIWLGATGAALLVPLTIDEELRGMLLLGPKRSEEPYTQEDREILMAVAAQLALTEDYLRLEGLAKFDPLTEALNRHSFYSLIEKPGARGDSRSGCVVVVDINDLKTINDSMGHAAGDIAIRQVASNVRSLVRADDLVFRWGGDEFLVVIFGLAEPVVRERFRLLDSLFDASGIRETIPLSVSFGIAPFSDIAAIPRSIDAADREMYERKAEGSQQANVDRTQTED